MKNPFKMSNLFIGFSILLIIVLIIYIVTPTGVSEQQEDRLTRVYFADNISIAHQKLIDRFNSKYQGEIEVIPVNLPFTKFSTNERKELLARTLRSKSNRIDVFAVDLIWVPRFARWCLPLDSLFVNEELDKISEHALASCYYYERLLSIPLYADIGIMYYRKDIIETLPDAKEIEQKLKNSITWGEFIQLKKQLSNLTNPFYIFAADSYEGLICSFIEGLASLNKNLTIDDFIRLNSPNAKKTLQLLVDLVHKYQMTPPIVTKYDEFECYLQALENDAIFLRGWPGFLRHYRHVIEDTSKFKYLEKCSLPYFNEGRPAYVFGGWNLMISKYSTKADAAIKFIKFALLEENQKMFFQVGGYLPIIRSIYQDSVFLHQEPDLLFYRELFNKGIHRPYFVDYTKVSDIMSYYINLAIKGEIAVDEALERATYEINSNQIVIK